jgi:hypothetical protein
MYECDNNQTPYYNVKVSKNQNFGNFGPLVTHGLHWINFIILTFISQNNRYFRGLYKIWNKIISFDMKKKVKCTTCHGKNEKKSEFGSPWNEFLGFKCGTSIMFGPPYLVVISNAQIEWFNLS